MSRLSREHDLLLIAKKEPASVSMSHKKKNGVQDERNFGPLCPRSAFLVSTSKTGRADATEHAKVVLGCQTRCLMVGGV